MEQKEQNYKRQNARNNSKSKRTNQRTRLTQNTYDQQVLNMSNLSRNNSTQSFNLYIHSKCKENSLSKQDRVTQMSDNNKMKNFQTHKNHQQKQLISRDIEVLQRKKITNHKLLMDQLKNLISLAHLQILNHDIKDVKNQIIKFDILCHRLKISKRSKSKKALSSYRDFGNKIISHGTENVSKFRQRQNKFKSHIALNTKQRQQHEKIKILMKDRFELIKTSISEEKQYFQKKTSSITKENQFIKNQTDLIEKVTYDRSQCVVEYLSKTPNHNNKKEMNIDSKISDYHNLKIKSRQRTIEDDKRKKNITRKFQVPSPYYRF